VRVAGCAGRRRRQRGGAAYGENQGFMHPSFPQTAAQSTLRSEQMWGCPPLADIASFAFLVRVSNEPMTCRLRHHPESLSRPSETTRHMPSSPYQAECQRFVSSVSAALTFTELLNIVRISPLLNVIRQHRLEGESYGKH
jgi:hypothetical protein